MNKNCRANSLILALLLLRNDRSIKVSGRRSIFCPFFWAAVAFLLLFFQGLEPIKEFSVLEETTFRPENATLLEMYSDGKALGMGIGA